MSPHDSLATRHDPISIPVRVVTAHGPIQSQVDRTRLLQYDVVNFYSSAVLDRSHEVATIWCVNFENYTISYDQNEIAAI